MEQDLRLARQLQEQYDRELAVAEEEEGNLVSGQLRPPSVDVGRSVVDPAWELLDPSPDVRALFLQFNERFFWGKLSSVEVKWSPRMTLCAGVCSYEGRGGLCSIRLSEPLLKLRPRKDLVETLLHEMIHALLFVTNNDKDHDSHGSEFRNHMHRINGIAGSNISIYHNFHDEVDEYRKHWWQCNGPCQNRKPYFGYVKRAMNRPPSAIDPWWADHQKTCGGTFLKIKEPENYSKKGKEKNKLVHPQNSKPSENKGKLSGGIVPFSGKGYLLGKPSDSTLSERSISLGSTRIPSLSEIPRSESGSSLKIPLSSNKKLPVSYVTSIDSNKLSSNKKRQPNVSVSNTKIFKNINGSPVKIYPIFNKGERSKQSQQAILSPEMMQACFLNEVTLPRKKATSALDEPNSIKGTSKQSIYRRMDDKSASANLFVKTSDDAGNRYRTSVLKNHLGRTDEKLSSSSSFNSQNTRVTCPICRTDVLEAKINDHLDSCLVV